MGVRAALLRSAIRLAEYARSNHEPENAAMEGVELICPACKTPWPCAQATEHTERIARLREELADGR